MLGKCRITAKTTELFLYVTTLTFCIHALGLVEASNDVPSVKSLDDVSQIDNEFLKRGWKTDLPMWGKRGWSNLHPGWGKRLSESDDDINYSSEIDKRAWHRLQGGWGKRFIPSEEDMVIRQLAAALDENAFENNNIDYYPERQFDTHDVDKRSWNQFTDGWGKRSNKLEKFRGSWGKREPSWNNLKGLWGKRSIAE